MAVWYEELINRFKGIKPRKNPSSKKKKKKIGSIGFPSPDTGGSIAAIFGSLDDALKYVDSVPQSELFFSLRQDTNSFLIQREKSDSLYCGNWKSLNMEEDEDINQESLKSIAVEPFFPTPSKKVSAMQEKLKSIGTFFTNRTKALE